jgi:hypothetical protein
LIETFASTPPNPGGATPDGVTPAVPTPAGPAPPPTPTAYDALLVEQQDRLRALAHRRDAARLAEIAENLASLRALAEAEAREREARPAPPEITDIVLREGTPEGDRE